MNGNGSYRSVRSPPGVKGYGKVTVTDSVSTGQRSIGIGARCNISWFSEREGESERERVCVCVTNRSVSVRAAISISLQRENMCVCHKSIGIGARCSIDWFAVSVTTVRTELFVLLNN